MSFEDDIRARMPVVQEDQLRQAALARDVRKEEERQAAERQRQWDEATARAREIGTQAASMLLAANIPTIPIWDYREYGKAITEQRFSISAFVGTHTYRKKALTHVGEGWHIATVSGARADFEHMHSPDLYSLSTEGVAATFDRTVLPAYPDPQNNNKPVRIEGIIAPKSNQYPGQAVKLLESDLFLNSIAWMLQTGGQPYRLHIP